MMITLQKRYFTPIKSDTGRGMRTPVKMKQVVSFFRGAVQFNALIRGFLDRQR
jgi:hypothetical protein